MHGMIVSPTKRCELCKELGIWGVNNQEKTRRCHAHKYSDDKNLIEGNCVSCGLETVLSPNKICGDCGNIGVIKRTALQKQHHVKEQLELYFKIESYDRMVDGGICSRRRPDIIIDSPYRKIVVEIDEYQHKRSKDYSPDCEYRRMWDITQALGMPTTFIRFNPDAYRTEMRHIDTRIQERIDTLISWIRTLSERLPMQDTFLSVLYLYYDGFTSCETVVEEPVRDIFERQRKYTDKELDDYLMEILS
jgi:hypothetical protein